MCLLGHSHLLTKQARKPKLAWMPLPGCVTCSAAEIYMDGSKQVTAVGQSWPSVLTRVLASLLSNSPGSPSLWGEVLGLPDGRSWLSSVLAVKPSPPSLHPLKAASIAM